MWTQTTQQITADGPTLSPMPFGCESYVDKEIQLKSLTGSESPMPFGCESYVDPVELEWLPPCDVVTNAFRL